jgi:CCR4-NOT transcriptional complex subunit CAF120
VSAYEKSRLEEIYTAHILRLSYNVNEDNWKGPVSHLSHGSLVGEVKILIIGETEWRSVWAMVSASSSGPFTDLDMIASLFHLTPSNTVFDTHAESHDAIIKFYPSQKDKKKSVLTIRNVTQAFAVYPKRPELITRSTVIKIEGLIGDEDVAGDFKRQEGWVYIDTAEGEERKGLMELLKWITGKYTLERQLECIDNLFSGT